jgi:hypothetical protein
MNYAAPHDRSGMMPLFARPRWTYAPRSLALGAVCIALLAIAHIALFWPGIMTWDAIRQYGQALSGHYDDWHPPAMNWLWRQLHPLAAGPAPMLLLQVALYWGGIALWLRAAMREHRAGGRAALVIGVLAVSPVALVLIGTRRFRGSRPMRRLRSG